MTVGICSCFFRPEVLKKIFDVRPEAFIVCFICFCHIRERGRHFGSISLSSIEEGDYNRIRNSDNRLIIYCKRRENSLKNKFYVTKIIFLTYYCKMEN